MREILSPKRLRLLRYLLAKILKTLRQAFTFSMKIRSLEIRLLLTLSSSVSGLFFVFFFGSSLFLWKSSKPWNPLSAYIFIHSATALPNSSLYSLKSWTFPSQWAIAITSSVFLSTNIRVFMLNLLKNQEFSILRFFYQVQPVCFFFFPE